MRHAAHRRCLHWLLLFFCASSVSAQTPPAYAVVAIHQGEGPMGGWGIQVTPTGLKVHNCALRYIIQQAYDIFEENRISGPAWIDSARYDILANVDAEDLPAFARASDAQRMLMLQALLRDRFKLQVHLELRELPAYTILIAKGHPTLTPTDPTKSTMNDASGKPICHANHATYPEDLPMLACTIPDLANILSMIARRPVIDQTGLHGQFDFTLRWQRDSGAESPAEGLSLFNAIQDQLGLKLKEIITPLQVIVVDHVEKPTEN